MSTTQGDRVYDASHGSKQESVCGCPEIVRGFFGISIARGYSYGCHSYTLVVIALRYPLSIYNCSYRNNSGD